MPHAVQELHMEGVSCVFDLVIGAPAINQAPARFHDSITALQQLTHLTLRNVDLAGVDSFQRLPPGNLTNLRQAASRCKG